MRFIGTIDAKVDSKGRVFLPAIFRRAFQEEAGLGETSGEVRLVMRKDVFEDCLVLYPEEVWYKRLDELKQRLSVWNKAEQAMLRKYVKDAEWLTLDSNGRFLLSKRYLQMAGIEGEVTFVGMDGTIEVWAKQKLEAQQSDDEFALNIESIMCPASHTDNGNC